MFGFLPPPIMGLGTAGGFAFELQDRGGAGITQLQQAAHDLVAAGNASPKLTRLNQNFRATRAAALPGHRPRPRPRPTTCRWTEVFGDPAAPTWARPTSTTSTSSGAPGR